MTIVQKNWLRYLPASPDAEGTYWAYNHVTKEFSLAEVEWCADVERFKIHVSFLGTITPIPSFSTFLRDHQWQPVKKPVQLVKWEKELPKGSGVFWACNTKTKEIFAIEMSYTPTDQHPYCVFLPKCGMVPTHPDVSAFLQEHEWLRVNEPPPPPRSKEAERLDNFTKAWIENEDEYKKLAENWRKGIEVK